VEKFQKHRDPHVTVLLILEGHPLLVPHLLQMIILLLKMITLLPIKMITLLLIKIIILLLFPSVLKHVYIKQFIGGYYLEVLC
jgi:hypothetical protein